MTVTQIIILAAISVPFMRFVPSVWRPWGLLVGSVFAVAWMMADSSITMLDGLLLGSTLALIVIVWWMIRLSAPASEQHHSDDILSIFILLAAFVVIILVGGWIGDGEIPSAILVTAGFASIGLWGFRGILKSEAGQDYAYNMRTVAGYLVAMIILILVVLKVPTLAEFFGETLNFQSQSIAQTTPLVWLGFSYIAFRLMALLLDFRAGRLSKVPLSLRDVTTYVLFFPAFTAGPIDRAQRFIPEINDVKPLESARLIEGAARIAVGMFKKFVIADSLALVSMSPALINDTNSAAGLWVMLYLYTFQIFFDFSGYSDVAIGLGRLYGFSLPENFDRPYLQPNLQLFWQRWHITLSTWFRVYYFTPFSRLLIQQKRRPPQPVIIFLAQLSTMVLIGLWHGVTVNFFLWGAWHGIGLFLHKTLADHTRGWYKRVSAQIWSSRLLFVLSLLATFHFVALGWVFFALPEPSDSFDMLARLFGF